MRTDLYVKYIKTLSLDLSRWCRKQGTETCACQSSRNLMHDLLFIRSGVLPSDHRLHELIHQLVVLLSAFPLLLKTDVQRVVTQRLKHTTLLSFRPTYRGLLHSV